MRLKPILLFLGVLLLDIASKYWVSHNLPLIQCHTGYPFGGIGLLETPVVTAAITYTTNTGSAWGFFSSFPKLLVGCRLLIVGGLISYLLFFKPKKHLIPLSIIAAGALGNILDFFFYGHVIDMFYLIFYKYSYPIFNIADSAIFCSVVYLIFSKKSKQAHAASN